MKWESIKDKVGREVYTSINAGLDTKTLVTILVDLIGTPLDQWPKNPTHHRLLKIYADKAWEIIMQWDIRSVGRLRDLFPHGFPPSLKKGRLHCYMDAQAEWCVEVAA